MNEAMTVAERLFHLQSIETELRDVSALFDQSPEAADLAESQERLKKLDILMRRTTKSLSEKQLVLRRLELDLKSIEEQIAKNEAQMFDGTVTDARGLANLQERMASDRVQMDALEESVIDEMENIEEAEHQIEKIESVTNVAKKNHAKTEAKFKAVQNERSEQLNLLNQKRKEVRAELSRAALQRYDRVGARIERPVAKVSERTCLGCHMTLPTSVQRPRDDEILSCPQCSRILWWP